MRSTHLIIINKTIRQAFFALIAVLLFGWHSGGANAADEIIEPPQEVDRWYAALGAVNRREFRELIADDAKIVLKDIGVEQTKNEFIKSLDEWEEATRQATMVYGYTAYDDNSASVLVCYRFESNQQLILETFTFANLQITGSVQEPKGDDCGDL